jgi:hypothetical protein
MSGYHHGINRGTVRLGSVKTGRLNYERDHTYYHGQGVIAPEVKQAVADMKNLTDRDLLGRKRPEWTASVAVPKAEMLTYTFK